MKKQGRGARERERNKRGKATGHRVQREEVKVRGWGWKLDKERRRKRPSEVTGYRAERDEFKKIRLLGRTKRDGENKNGDG